MQEESYIITFLDFNYRFYFTINTIVVVEDYALFVFNIYRLFFNNFCINKSRVIVNQLLQNLFIKFYSTILRQFAILI